ncbi:MAG TPA: hypothetical protein VMA54_18695 [Steroidobacteraceae bacterium]|nr:hypothetical protein [Steroidobacteraceae bacterium]
MASQSAAPPDNVFVNCPFDDEYATTFQALIFAIRACGFLPRSARELDDGGQPRIDKLYSLIQDCRYGIHDLSRTDLDPVHRLPRFNMPLELGIFLGARRYGRSPQRDKRLLIFDIEQYRYQKFISDLAGMDIHAHSGQPETALVETRHWLTNVSRRHLLGEQDLLARYRAFRSDLPALAVNLNLDPARITYADFDLILEGWLESRPIVRT